MLASTSDLSAKSYGKTDGKVTASVNSSRTTKPSKAKLRLAAQSQDEQKPEERDEPDDPAPPPVLPTDEELKFERPRDLNLLTRDEMLSLAGKYEADIEDDVAHAEAARSMAYKNRDVIKLTCIDDKLVQMKLISNSTAAHFRRIARVRSEEFSVRAEFMIIAPNWKRTKELREEVESCIGESLNTVTVVSVSHTEPEIPGPDPTQPPDPKLNSERVPEASPWR